MSTRQRLDQYLAESGLATSRSRARDMVLRGCVDINGQSAKKHSQMVSQSDSIVVTDPAQPYVSRAALKLIAGLDHAEIDVADRTAIDLGASTGGFTQVLLERGIAHVLAIDVGHGQMEPVLSQEARVTLLEKLNARDLVRTHLRSHQPDLIVSDLSFVSVILAAEPALLLAHDTANAVLLIKPQFEVGKDGVGKGGLVTDQSLIESTLKRITNWFNNLDGWQMSSLTKSPITGGDGNQEYLLCGKRDP